MHVLVTGGAGFIGSHVVDELIDHGHEVSVLDNLSTGSRRNVNSRARLIQMDLRDPELKGLLAELRPEVISHHAAQPSVVRSMQDPVFDLDVNMIGSVKLLEAAAACKTRKLIFASTCAVYGDAADLPVDEMNSPDPSSGYGLTKWMFERYLAIYAPLLGVDFSILRYANVYGPRQLPHGEAGVVAIFMSHLLNGETCNIFGDGEQSRDFLFVGECAQVNRLMLDPVGLNTVLNVGTGRLTTVNELYAAISEACEAQLAPNYEPERPGEIRHLSLDSARLQRVIDWKPSTSLATGLERTQEYFSEGQIK